MVCVVMLSLWDVCGVWLCFLCGMCVWLCVCGCECCLYGVCVCVCAVAAGSSGGAVVPCGGPAELQGCSAQCPGHEPWTAAVQPPGGVLPGQTVHGGHGDAGEEPAGAAVPDFRGVESLCQSTSLLPLPPTGQHPEFPH